MLYGGILWMDMRIMLGELGGARLRGGPIALDPSNLTRVMPA